ncbi:MAG: polynucleotide adenylyltransferase PcnB [Myxococcota bacterium]
MGLLVETLRVIREVRDWAQSRKARGPAAADIREALETTARRLEVEVGLSPTPVDESQTYEQPKASAPVASSPATSATGSESAAPVEAAQTAVEVDRAEDEGPVEAEGPDIEWDRLDPHAVSAVRRLRKHGHTAYLVGGCVRDLLLGMPPKDFDVSTDAKPEEVKAIFRNSRVIGRRFRLVHLYYRGGKIIEVATFRANAQSTEEEGEESKDLLIRRDNVFGSEEEDAQRRDFTINGLFYDVHDGKIIDHVGGLPDVKARYLRMIGDPDIRLREDPVRILRAVRFHTKNQLQIDPELLTGIQNHRDDLARCAPARLLEEVLKLLRAGQAAPAITTMLEWGVLPVLLPEISAYVEGTLVPEGPASRSPRDSADHLLRHLQALDIVVARRPVGDAAILAALLLAPLLDLQDDAGEDPEERHIVFRDFVEDFGRHITLTRRIQESLRQILQAQKALGRAGAGASRRRRRGSAFGIVQKPWFSDALALYEVRCRALELPLDEVMVWSQRGLAAGIDEIGPLPPDGPEIELSGEDIPNPSPSGPNKKRRRKRKSGRSPRDDAEATREQDAG